MMDEGGGAVKVNPVYDSDSDDDDGKSILVETPVS